MNAHKKVRNAATAVVLCIGMVLSVFLTAFQVRAESSTYDDFSQFVTSYTLKVTNGDGTTTKVYLDKDSAGADLSTVQIADGTTISLQMQFALEDDSQVKDSTFTMQLPGALSITPANIKDNEPFYIADASNQQIQLGTWSLDQDGNLTVKFGSDADGYYDRAGHFAITSTFSVANLGNDSGGVIPFQIGAATVDLPVQVIAPSAPPKITKDGDYNAADGTIKWTVTVDAGNNGRNGGLTDVTVKDSFSANQTFLPSGTQAPTWDGAEVKDSSLVPREPPAYVYDGADHVTFYLGNMKHNEEKQLIYYTQAETSGVPTFPNTPNNQYKNTATLGADEITSNPPTATNTVSDGTTFNWVVKALTATADSSDTNLPSSFDWKIAVNPDGGIVPAGATVTDTLPQYLSLDNEMQGVSLDGGVTFLTKDDTGASVYYTTSTDANGIETITVHFTDAVSTEQVISFTTNVAPDYYNGNNEKFSNKATLSQGGHHADSNTVTGVGTGSSVISKTQASGTAYNAANHQATWTITVNKNGIAMTDPIVTDTVDTYGGTQEGDHQVFDSGISGFLTATQGGTPITLTQTDDSGYMNDHAGTYFISGDKKTLTAHLADFPNKGQPVVLTVITKVTDPNYYGVNNQNNTVYNTALLTASGNAIQGGSPASQKVKSTVLSKGGSYNYANKKLTWTITVDQNNMPMTNAVVTDPLPAGLVFDGSVEVGTMNLGTDSAAAQYYEISADTPPVLTIHLGTISAQTKITVTETMPDDTLKGGNNAGFGVSNTASLHFDGGPTAGISYTYTQNIDQSVVEKTGSYDSVNNQLVWHVLINKNRIPAGEFNPGSGTVTLTDDLNKNGNGLVLDPASVKLYQLAWGTGADNGKWVETGAAIPGGTVSYDAATHVFTFTFPSSGIDFSNAYQLDFSTDITLDDRSSYTNSVDLDGALDNSGGQATGVQVNLQDVDYGFSGKQAGKVLISKQDAVTGDYLGGATFTLLQGGADGFQLLSTTTKPDGTAEFDHLKQGVQYTVKETGAPADYQIDDPGWQTFTLDARNVTQALTFHDTKTPSSQASSGSSSEAGSSPSSTASSQPGGGNHDNGGGSGETPSSSSPTSSASSSAASGASSSPAGTPDASSAVSKAPGGGVAGTVLTGPASLYIKKADPNGKALSGASFTLFDANGKALQKKVTGASGVIAFTDLPAGDYVVRETKAPAGYELYSGELDVALAAGQKPGYTLRDGPKGSDASVLGWTSDNSLPKTGGFPIAPLVAVCGLLLIATGLVVRRKDPGKKRMKHLRKL